MALTSGFFTSVGGDRKYSTDDFAKIFNSLITDGVFANHGNLFAVGAGTGLNVTVNTGYAWFDSTWTYNDAVMNVLLDGANISNDRIDAIVLETHPEIGVRANSITFVKGEAGVSPQRPGLNENQHALAYVRVRAGSQQILASDIVNVVGTGETPLITGILETADISALLANWNAQAEDWLNSFEADESAAFTAWFNALQQDLIDGQAAANLDARLLATQAVVNDMGKETAFTLTSASFSAAGVYTVSMAGLDADVRANICYAKTATMAQRAAFNQACLMVTSVSNNSFTVRALGIKPTIDIPCVLQVLKASDDLLS